MFGVALSEVGNPRVSHLFEAIMGRLVHVVSSCRQVKSEDIYMFRSN